MLMTASSLCQIAVSILITLISSIVLNNALMSWSSSFKLANNFVLIM